jgi:hypothetical protein
MVNPEDEPDIMSWYVGQGFESEIPREALPSRGVMVDGLACAWLYETDSALGWIGFPVINPEANKAKAFRALDAVFDFILEFSSELNMKVMFTSFGHTSLKRLALLKNFNEGDTNVSNFWRHV